MKKESSIRPYVRQFYRGNMLCLFLALMETLLWTGSSIMISWLLQVIVDMTAGAEVGFTFRELLWLTLAGLGLEAGAFAFGYVSKPRFIARAIGQYRTYIFERMCRKGIAAFSGENSALYLSALSNDASSIESNYLSNLFVILDNGILCVGALALMFWYSPKLTFVSLGLSALPLLAALTTGGLVAKAEKQVSDRNEAYMETLKDSLAGFSVIKSFRAEAQMCHLYSRKEQEVSEAKCFRRKMNILVRMLSSCAGSVVQFGVFLMGAYLALTGEELSAGSVLVFVQLLNFVINPIGAIPQALAERKAARALIQKIADALDEGVREDGMEHMNTLREGIRLEKLTFGYGPEKQVLRDIDFTFEAGKSYAIVGASGSGKSTLLNLITAAHSDYGGAIRFDGTELRQIRSESLYDLISLVQQNVFLFNSSIRDNITMFAPFSEDEVEHAIRCAGLSELIRERGEDYLCGENGSGLSGGEKQRIAIARSLLKRSKVLLADEATAALDAATAFRITDAILDLEGLTRIVVTHALDERLLCRYDCILTLKNGQVEEQGSFRELMDQGGYFYSLYTVSQS